MFVSYMDEEMSKGYQRPTYPHKMWTTIVRLFDESANLGFPRGYTPGDNLLSTIGFVKPNTKIYTKDYCEDLSLIRTGLDSWRASRSGDPYHTFRDTAWNEMDRRHINKYL